MRALYHNQFLRYIIFLCTCTLLLVSLNHQWSASKQNHLEASLNINEDSSTMRTSYSKPGNDIRILFWTPYIFPHEKVWDGIFKRLVLNQCAENRCKLLYNKTEYKTADAVIFSLHFMNVHNNYGVPPTHPENQLWIMFTFEAKYALYNKCQPQMLAKLGFNWTMHFRKDSDVVMPFGAIKKIEDPNNSTIKPTTDYWSRKDKVKLAAWMVSNCKSDSSRETYVQILKKHIRIDVYGSCGRLKCGAGQYPATEKRWKLKECTDVVNKYFFYLAFENSICRDWVTEKFFRTLGQDVVPVVMGGADYKQLAPPNSYIDALEFSSPKNLADFLEKVSSSPVLYNRYLEWKSYYTVDVGFPYSPMVCGLCEKLHQQRFSKSLVGTKSNLTSWFADAGCQGTWKQFIKNNHVNI